MGINFGRQAVCALVTLGLLASCGAKKDKVHPDLEQSNAMILSRLEVESTTPMALDAERFGVITHHSLTIKACFSDAATLSKLASLRMSVDGEEARSDAEGCLFWNEKIEIPTDGKLNLIRFSKNVTLSNSHFSKIVEYQINPYDGKIVNLDHAEEIKPDVSKNDFQSSLSIEKLNVQFSGFTSANGTSLSNRKYKSELDGCIRSKSSLVKLERFIGKKIQIEIKNEKTEIIDRIEQQIDTEGCIKLAYQDSANLLGQNKWIKRTVIMRVDDLELSRDFAVNPIERKSNFFWDLRRGEAPAVASQEHPRLVVDKMRYTFIGNEDDGFRVNEYLEMSLVKSYQLELEPSLSYGHEFQGEVGPHALYNGQFKIQFMLLAPKNGDMEITAQNLEGFEILSKYEAKAELRDGKISTTLELPFLFTDLPKAVTRTLAIIKLQSVDDPELTSIVTGPFHASTHQFSVGMREFERFESGDKLDALNLTVYEKLAQPAPVQLNQDGTLKSPWKIKPLDVYRELHKNAPGLEPLNIKTISAAQTELKLNLTANELKNFIRGNYAGKELSRFCSIVYPSKIVEGWIWDSTVYDTQYFPCMRDPAKYIDVKSIKHIQKILSRPERVYSSTDRINIGSGFFFFKTESERESWARRWSAGADIGMKFEVPFIKLFSVGAKTAYDISYMKSKDLSMGETSRGSLSRSRNIYADMLRLSFKANALSCLNIQGTFYESQGATKRSSKRIQICEDKLVTETIEESWYYMGESDPTMSLLRDRWSNKENMMIKMLRGQKNFESFYNLMADDTKVVFLHKVETLKGPDAYFARIYSKADGSAPSLEDGAIPGVVEQ